MADVPQTLALIVAAQEYGDEIIQQINRKSATLQVLNVTPGSGPNCAWPVEEDGHIAQNHADGSDVVDFGSDGQAGAVLQWGLYEAPFRVTTLAQSAAATTSPGANRPLYLRNMKNAAAKLASTMNAALHTGAGTGTTVAGFGVAIGNATNTYAGIDRSTETYWRPYVVDALAAAISIPLIRTDMGNIYDACGENPDIAICDTTTFNKVGALFDANRQYTTDTLNVSRGQVVLRGGFSAIEFDGMYFIKDKDAAASSISYMNSNYVEIEVLRQKEAIMMEMQGEVMANDGFNGVPLGMHFTQLAKTGHSDKGMVSIQMQLKVLRPNACGQRTNIG